MPEYPQAGVQLVAEIDDYRASMNEALALAQQFDALGELSVTITVQMDAGDIENELSSSIPDNVSVDVTPDVSSMEGDITAAIPDDESVTVTPDVTEDQNLLELESLDGETLTPTITATVTDNQSLLDLETLDDAPIKPQIDPEETPDGKTVLDGIKQIRNLQAIQIAINIAGTALDFVKAWGAFTAGPILDADQAMSRFQAQTGATDAQTKQFGDTIKSVYFDDLGESINQVSAVATAAQQMGTPIDESTRAALSFTKVFTNEDPVNTLKTLQALVTNGLSPSYQSAADLLTKAYQEGDNKAGDLQNTIQKQAVTFKDMGLTGEQTFSTINTGLQSGLDSANSAAIALDTFKKNLQAAATNPTAATNDVLKQIGVDNPVEQGQKIGADTLTAIVDGIKNAPPGQLSQDEMAQIIFGKQGVKNASALLGIDPNDDMFANIKNQAAKAGADIDKSLQGALDDFSRSVQEFATNFLSSDQIDLPGKIDAIKTGLADALSAIQRGDSVSNAIVIGLKPLGLDTLALTLENAVNDLIIGILQAMATIQTVLGQGDQAKGTQQTISGLAQGGLTTALKINPDDAQSVATSVDTALKRGIDPTTIGTALKDAVKDMVDSGDFQKAQELIDNFKKVGITLNPGQDVAGTNANINASLAAAQNAITRGGEGLGVHSAQGGANAMLSDLAQTQTTQALNDMASAATDLTPTVRDAEQAENDRKTTLSELKTETVQSTASLDDLTGSSTDLGDAAFDANLAQSDAASSLAGLVAQEQALEAQLASGAISLDEFNQKFAALIAIAQSGANATSAAPGTPPPASVTGHGHAGGTDDDSGTFMVGEEGRELVTSDRRLAVLNNKTTEAIMAAVSGSLGRGSVTSNGGSKVVNLTQINNVPNIATADALGYRTAQQIRG